MYSLLLTIDAAKVILTIEASRKSCIVMKSTLVLLQQMSIDKPDLY